MDADVDAFSMRYHYDNYFDTRVRLRRSVNKSFRTKRNGNALTTDPVPCSLHYFNKIINDIGAGNVLRGEIGGSKFKLLILVSYII